VGGVVWFTGLREFVGNRREEPEDETVLDRFYQIQERIADLSEGEETWPDAANAGAVIGIGHDGEAEIRRGLIKPENGRRPGSSIA
jgi:hypothetical protein